MVVSTEPVNFIFKTKKKNSSKKLSVNDNFYLPTNIPLKSSSRDCYFMCLDLQDTTNITSMERMMLDESSKAEAVHLWKMLSEDGVEVEWK
jgi:hypothetical protein